MAYSIRHDRSLSVEEYFARELESAVRHEYVAGAIHALSGVSRRHGRITANILARVWAAAHDGPCRFYQSDVRLRAAADVIYYPDIMVACGPAPADKYIEDSPCLVVEVLSPSTESIDRREKAMVYRGIASLEMYLIVDQETRHVEWYSRASDRSWHHTVLEGSGRIALPCLDVDLALDEIYEGLDPLTPDERRHLRETELAWGGSA